MNRLTDHHIKNRLLISLTGFIFLVACLFASPAMAVTKLKLSMIFPPSSYTFTVMKKYAKEVKEQTNGEIVISVFPPGAIAKPGELFDLVKRGAIDMGFSAGLLNARKVPEGLVEFSLPFSFVGTMGTTEAAEQFYEYMYEWRGGKIKTIFEEAYAKHGVKFIGGGPGGGYGFMTNFPVKTIEDLKGKKIRSFGLINTIVKKLGASSVTIATPEQYLALQRGTIDATVYTYYAVENYKFKEVITHIIYPPVITTPIISMYANMKKMKRLTTKQQNIIDTLFMENMRYYTGKAIDLENEGIAKAKAYGVKEVTLPAADVKKLRKIGMETWALATRRPNNRNKELVQLTKEFLAEKGVQ